MAHKIYRETLVLQLVQKLLDKKQIHPRQHFLPKEEDQLKMSPG